MMMHQHLRAFVSSAADAFNLHGPVYEFGFRLIEASAAAPWRECFPETGYIGLDVDGQGEVDGLEDLSRLPFPDAAARTIIGIRLLERVLQPQQTVKEMIRILAPGGALLLAASLDDPCRAQTPMHRQLQPGCLRRLLDGLEVVLIGWQGAAEAPHTVYGVGFKAPAAGSILEGTHRFLESFQTRLDRLALPTRWPQRLEHHLLAWLGTRAQRRRRGDYYAVEFVVDVPGNRDWSRSSSPDSLSDGKTGTRLDLLD